MLNIKTPDIYIDRAGCIYQLGELTADERELVDALLYQAKRHADWGEFDNYWMPLLDGFYSRQGLSRRAITKTPLWRITQDISGRLGVAANELRDTDYRDELEELIRSRFRTQREFCEATGLSEDMLSHVLARRKHLAIDTLEEALEKVGYSIHIRPLAGREAP